MASIEENKRYWSGYDWSSAGNEWSEAWGGTENVWWGTVYPRIRAFLPTATILELGPGYGRFSRYLRDACEELVLVDLTPNCVDACRESFEGDERVSVFVNDGRSLPMVEPSSIDFVFSFDSLVHAEADAIDSYLGELARKLKPQGAGFIHHSNLAALRAEEGGADFENAHWRAESMSAERFVSRCEEVGLVCTRQEIATWGGEERMWDCFSVFTRPGSRFATPYQRRENPDFMREASTFGAIASFYGR